MAQSNSRMQASAGAPSATSPTVSPAAPDPERYPNSDGIH